MVIMIDRLDSLAELVKWILNIPLIILCIDEFQKALRTLRMDNGVKKRWISCINFLIGIAFAIAYIPNVYLRESESCIFLIASWLCLYSVSNRINKTLERYAGIRKENYHNWNI